MEYEVLATSAIQTSISKTARLSSYINSGDKEPSWDGNIYLHECDKKTKRNIYKIPVQVKGKGISKLDDKKTTYSVSKIDLVNYQHDGGTVFFVVYIDKKTGDTKQIYYATLLPKKIDKLLKNAGEKSVSIELYPFPEDEMEKLNVFLFFKRHKEMQAVMLSKPNFDVGELMTKGMIDKLSFTISAVGLTEETIPQTMVEQKEFYFYANIKGTNLSFPFEYVNDISYAIVEKVIDKPVCTNGIQYYDSYKVIYNSKGNMLKFGESTVMNFKLVKNAVGKDMIESQINVKIQGTLRMRTKDLEFVLGMMESTKIEIAGIEIMTNIKEDEKKKFEYDLQKDNLTYLKLICQVLDNMNVKKDLEITKCTAEDYRNLARLYESIIEGKIVKGLAFNLPIVNRIKISNLELLVVFLEDQKQNGNYRLEDFFDTKMPVQYSYKENKEVLATSQFALLECDDFLNVDNINYEVIVADFKSIELSDGMITHANNVLLEMLKAFDISENADLYQQSLNFAEWLSGLDKTYICKPIDEINKLQIIKRKRKFSFQEREILHEIVRKNENEIWSIGALLLLDEQEEVQSRFEMLSREEKKQIESYPIGKFLVE